MEAHELVETFIGIKIPKTHATVGLSNLISTYKDYKTLFVNRRLPDRGWSDVEIQHLLFTLSTLDTNNKSSPSCDDGNTRWCGVGEREGRVYSPLVASRHFGLSHGIGRSGDIVEPQPKAVGSSVLVKLTLILALDAIRRGSGLDARSAAANGILLPLCTGMSMALVLSCLREKDPSKRIVLWSRIDQKSCFKAIQSAGLTCVVVPTEIDGDEVITSLEAMERAIKAYEGQVLAIITTTSCFAPRVPDKVDQVAKLCHTAEIAHIINHAYGLQCEKTCKLINRASTVGRVDAIICSTDKNFLVPVGGAIVLSPQLSLIEGVSKIYAGRASASPVVDLFITLLSMGMNGYKKVLSDRLDNLKSFPDKLREVAERHGERLLNCPSNTISFGITLDTLGKLRDERREDSDAEEAAVVKNITSFGAMLFSRCVSGTRVIPRMTSKTIGGHEFKGFGSSTEGYPHAYMTAACAVGVKSDEIEEFVRRLDKALKDFKKKMSK